MFKRSQRQFISWMAIAAMLLAALAPSLTHAISSWNGNPDGWQQICTSQGEKLVSVSGTSGAPAQGDSAGQTDHCAYCLLDPADIGPPLQAKQVVIEPDGVRLLAAGESFPSRHRLLWSSPHSRAPPA
jgi:hypothetical protein